MHESGKTLDARNGGRGGGEGRDVGFSRLHRNALKLWDDKYENTRVRDPVRSRSTAFIPRARLIYIYIYFFYEYIFYTFIQCPKIGTKWDSPFKAEQLRSWNFFCTMRFFGNTGYCRLQPMGASGGRGATLRGALIGWSIKTPITRDPRGAGVSTKGKICSVLKSE